MFVELGIIHKLDRFLDRTPYVVIIAGPCRRRRKVSTEEVEVKESRGKSSDGIGGRGELSLAVSGSLVRGVEGIAIDKGFDPFIEIECRDETNARSPTVRIQSG